MNARGSNRPTLDRSTFRTSRLLDFASEKELIAQTGHRPEAWPLVILKELVDNAIDAAEEAGVAPTVVVTVDESGITVTDNGPGMPAKTVEDILDFTVRVSSREAYVSPTRGAQGNALKTILAIPFVLDGEHGRVEIESRGIRHEIDFAIDHIHQEPKVAHRTGAADAKTGTSVRVYWPDSPRSILTDARDHFLQIATDYGWLNPHLRLLVRWFNKQFEFEATDPNWAKWLPSDPTSPHWYRTANIERLIAAYLGHDADSGRVRTVREFVAEFRGLTGTGKQKRVLDATGLARESLGSLVEGNRLNPDLVSRLLQVMKEQSKPVKPAMIGVIGKKHFEARMASLGCEMESFNYKKVLGVTDGVPWVVETAFGWCPEMESRRLITGVNWSPGIFNPFRELGAFGQSLDTILSQQRADRNEPIVLVLHMACPRVEYTDRGKSAVVVQS